MKTFDVAMVAVETFRNMNFSVEFFESTASTNLVAKNHFGEDRIYVARHQTHGRGRFERTWQDTGDALLMTISRKLNFNPQPIMAPLIGLALAEALQKTLPKVEFAIKPPNDIYLQTKKIAGILLESVVRGPDTQIIIGIGMNIFSAPRDGSFAATSLRDSFGLSSFDEMGMRDVLSTLLLQIESFLGGPRESLLPDEKARILTFLQRADLAYADIQADGSLVKFDGTTTDWSLL